MFFRAVLPLVLVKVGFVELSFIMLLASPLAKLYTSTRWGGLS
jgi:hypothetical protein